MASVAQASILWNTKIKCADCDKKFKSTNNAKVCSDCSTKRVKERKAGETRVLGQSSPSGKNQTASRYQPLSNVRMDHQISKPSFKLPSGLKVKRPADNIHDASTKTPLLKAARLNLSDSDIVTSKGVISTAFEEFEKNPSRSVPSSPTKVAGGTNLNTNQATVFDSESTNTFKDSEPSQGFVMIDLTKESDKSEEDEMPLYTAVVKAENMEEHVDTAPLSQIIYPVLINSQNIQDNHNEREKTCDVDVTNNTSISDTLHGSSVEISCGTLYLDSNLSPVQHPENLIEENCDAGSAQVENLVISKETQQNLDQSPTESIVVKSIPLAESSNENLNGSKDSGIMDTSETILATNAQDSPLVISVDKPNSDGPSDQVISLVTGVFKELDILGFEQLKVQEEELRKELSERFPEDVYSLGIEREKDIFNQLSLKSKEEETALSSKKQSVTAKRENSNSILFFVKSCQEEYRTLAARLQEIGDSTALYEKLNKELEDTNKEIAFSKSLVASAQSDLGEVIHSCLEGFDRKKNRITEELDRLTLFRQTEQSTKSSLARAKAHLKMVDAKHQNALKCQQEEETLCAALIDSCAQIGLQIDESQKRISEFKNNLIEMSRLEERILTTEYLRKMKEIAIKRDF